MTRAIRYLLAATATLVGCSYTIEITAHDLESGVPRFTLRENSTPLIGRCPRLREFAVVEEWAGQFDYQKPLWRVSLEQGKRTCEVAYGTVPSGLAEAAPPQPLQIGHRYRALADAWGSVGWLDFTPKAS